MSLQKREENEQKKRGQLIAKHFLSNSSPDSFVLTFETPYSPQPKNLTRLFSPKRANQILLLSHIYQLPKGVTEKVSMDGSRLLFPPSIQSAAILPKYWPISKSNPGTPPF